MKTLITSILLLISFLSYCQDYTIVQINASWNTRNDVKLPDEINGSKVIYGILEDQPSSIRKSTKAVPIVLIYKNNKPHIKPGRKLLYHSSPKTHINQVN